jgi:hypothetical protein
MKYVLLLLTALMVSLPVVAQETQNEGLTVEEAWLKSTAKVRKIKALAGSEDYATKYEALVRLDQMVADGEVGSGNADVVEVLQDLGQEGTGRLYMEQGTVKNDFNMIRRYAVQLLGDVGGEESRRAVTNILAQEVEPMVMSEAIMALAKIGPDDDGVTLQIMANAMNSQTAMTKDANFAYTFALAIELMYDNGYDVSSDMYLFDELVKLIDMRNGYDTKVRKKALAVIDKIE